MFQHMMLVFVLFFRFLLMQNFPTKVLIAQEIILLECLKLNSLSAQLLIAAHTFPKEHVNPNRFLQREV